MVSASRRTRISVPSGMPIAAPSAMTETSRRSALRNASGMKPSASTASVISRSGEATCGETTVLASGTKISAAPKPEKPRASAAMKATPSRKASEPVERPGGRRESMSALS
jgi:hypothetical protein